MKLRHKIHSEEIKDTMLKYRQYLNDNRKP